VAFDITGVKFEPEYNVDGVKVGKYGDRYVLTVDLDGEQRLLGAPFNTGMESRDQTIQNIEKYLGNGGTAVKARASSAGNGWVLDPA
jgi:hypothetical protein